MSVFFCDSDCELWFSKIKELNIKVIGMPYTICEEMKDYDMGEKTDFKKFYQLIRSGQMPTTQALNPYDYTQYFEPVLKGGDDVLYVHFSHNLSGTFNYMYAAIKELEKKYPNQKVTVVDTLSISMGAGLIVYEAAKLHNMGASDAEVVKWVEENRQNFSAWFIVDDLNHLRRGGRVNNTVAFFGTMLNIKPLLKVNDEGKIVNVDKEIGKKKAIVSLLNQLKLTGQNVVDYPIVVVNADADDDAKFLIDKIHQYLGEGAEIWSQQVGPVIGAHCGPGTIGLIFHSKHR